MKFIGINNIAELIHYANIETPVLETLKESALIGIENANKNIKNALKEIESAGLNIEKFEQAERERQDTITKKRWEDSEEKDIDDIARQVFYSENKEAAELNLRFSEQLLNYAKVLIAQAKEKSTLVEYLQEITIPENIRHRLQRALVGVAEELPSNVLQYYRNINKYTILVTLYNKLIYFIDNYKKTKKEIFKQDIKNVIDDLKLVGGKDLIVKQLDAL